MKRIKLEDEVYEFIKEEVVDLFERYDVNCIPVCGAEIALKMGINLIPYSALSSSQLSAAHKSSPDGFYLEPGNGKEYIFYNNSLPYTRVNMTILHEIGHCVLGHTNETDPEVAEAEAKFFAKYAAAPPPLVHKIRPEYPGDIEEAFDIGFEASCYAFSYYRKWYYHHCNSGVYPAYELRLLKLFNEIA